MQSEIILPSAKEQRQLEATRQDMDAIMRELRASSHDGREITIQERIGIIHRLTSVGGLRTLEPMLPLVLSLNGNPYSLRDHYPFSPVFNVRMPNVLMLKTGRQVSKSTSLASHGILLSNCVPFFRTLYICPLYEQIRRFSNNYVRPFIDYSPIKPLWSGTSTENSVLQRSFKNLSMMIFSFALLDADRVRGVSADKVAIDEVQDMDPDHIPIIHETLSHSDWGLTQYTGTPKSFDNPIEGLWQQSSMAEWFIPCHHGGCRAWNIPSLEYHVDAMIGPLHDNISEKEPGTICYKCRKPIIPRHGHWVHRHPHLQTLFAGYHVPQIIMPLHYARHDKWAELLAKQRGWQNTPISVFYNEVLGESVDVGQKLISETELIKASTLPWKNNANSPSPEMMKLLPHYKTRILAVDWGGGGAAGVSFTTLAVLGLGPDNRIHCLWGKRLLTPNNHLEEAEQVLHWMRTFRCQLLAHDYTGAGIVRETVLVQAGVDIDKVMPIQYVRAASKNLMKCVEATPLHNRRHYRLDKTRSLLYMFQAIKLQMLRFFEWDYIDQDNQGLITDLLALVEEKTESRTVGDIYTITRNPMRTDDFAQSINIGCAAIWHIHGWPNFAAAADVARITSGQIEAAGSADYGWDDDRSAGGGFFGMP